LLSACIYGYLRFLIGLLVLKLGSGDREVELLLLRQEVSLLRRTIKKPRLTAADRMILAALAIRVPRQLWGGLLVQPKTVLGWHRDLVRRKWAAFGHRRRPGRPRIDEECRHHILRLALENSRWGSLRIRGELLKLGHLVSAQLDPKLDEEARLPELAPKIALELARNSESPGLCDPGRRLLRSRHLEAERLHVLFFMELKPTPMQSAGWAAFGVHVWTGRSSPASVT
jgi:hypothetical protein